MLGGGGARGIAHLVSKLPIDRDKYLLNVNRV